MFFWVKHNTSVTDTEPIIRELNKINDEIAHYDVFEDALKLSVQEIERENAEDAYLATIANTEGQQRNINELNAQLDNIDIAIDVINDGLT